MNFTPGQLIFFLIVAIFNLIIDKLYCRELKVTFSYIYKNSLFGPYFPPIKVYCYNISNRWMPDSDFVKKLMFYPDSKEFQFFIEVEVHRELLLSPIITKNPEEADLFYVPIYPFACKVNEHLKNITDLIAELRQIGPWYDRKQGTDHIITSGYDPIYVDSPIKDEFWKGNMIICAPFPVGGKSWMKWLYQRNIVLPFVSYFPKYPFESVDWNKKRKNTVFIAHTYHTSNKSAFVRRKISDAVKKVKRNDLILFTRHSQRIVETVKKLPLHFMNSDFCICPRGDVPTAKRLFDAVYFGCIPVFVSDEIVFPFSGYFLDYSSFSLRIKEKDVDRIPEILESYSQDQIAQMRKELKKAAEIFRFRLGETPRIGEAFWAISWMWYIRHLYHLQFDFKYYNKYQ